MSEGLPLRVLDLFSGIGGFSLGLQRAGFRTAAFCEIEPFCRRVLARHWPGVPCYGDVRTLTGDRLRAGGISVDIICGGFPCQDISLAGKGAGLAGERSGLWREYARIVGEVRPRFVLMENVAALLGRGFGDVLGDLAALGYDAEWNCIPAGWIGAPHHRDRVWLVAYPSGSGMEGPIIPHDLGAAGSWGWRGETDLRAIARGPFVRGQRWPQPLLCRMDDGLPGDVERLHAIGNAVVPQIPEMIGRAIMAAECRMRAAA